MHIEEKAFSVLERSFKLKYGKELIGKDMGQFHSDFCWRYGNDQVECASESFFLAKEIYCDVLKMKSGHKNIMYRMKGICLESTKTEAVEKVKQEKPVLKLLPKGSFLETQLFTFYIRRLYESMYNGKAIDFDLCKGGKPLFEHNDDFSISSKQSFIRHVGVYTTSLSIHLCTI
jgi:hypothetical protein